MPQEISVWPASLVTPFCLPAHVSRTFLVHSRAQMTKRVVRSGTRVESLTPKPHFLQHKMPFLRGTSGPPHPTVPHLEEKRIAFYTARRGYLGMKPRPEMPLVKAQSALLLLHVIRSHTGLSPFPIPETQHEKKRTQVPPSL